MKKLGNMLKQAQELQEKMNEMQKQLEEMEVEGVSGGGMVRVMLSGKGEMKSVKVDPELVKPDDVEMLEDLIVAAHGDAKKRLEEKMTEEMSKLTGGIELPPGMQMPF
ncbi:MAG: YbaB/EbfC family nucleoid-associated protein [Alphaproteobacteria bacterium]